MDIPARVMLGDLLLDHKPKETLAVYRVAQQLSSNREYGLVERRADQGEAAAIGLIAEAAEAQQALPELRSLLAWEFGV